MSSKSFFLIAFAALTALNLYRLATYLKLESELSTEKEPQPRIQPRPEPRRWVTARLEPVRQGSQVGWLE